MRLVLDRFDPEIPLSDISYGIPGDAPTAVMLGALILHGIQPGPMLIIEQGNLIYGVFVAFLIANFAVLLLQLWVSGCLFTLPR